MLEFLNSPQFQAAGAYFFTAGMLAVMTGLLAMLWSGWLMAGRLSREVTPTLGGLVGLIVGVVSFLAWCGVILLVWGLFPADRQLLAIQCMQWGALLIMLVLIVVMAVSLPHARDVFKRRKGRVGERLVSKRLAKLGYEHLDNLYVGDGRNVAQVDHIARVGGMAVVIETKNLEGKLYPKPDGALSLYASDEKLPSPLPDPVKQVDRQVRAVRQRAGGLPVEGIVVFCDLAETPHGLPQGCVRLKDLGALLRLMEASAPPDEDSEAKWENLKRELASLDQIELSAKHAGLLGDNVAFRSLPRGTVVCRACKGSNLVIAHGYSYHWRCEDCKTCSRIRVDEGETLVMDDGVLYREGPFGKAVVEGQSTLRSDTQNDGSVEARPFPHPKPLPRMPVRSGPDISLSAEGQAR